MCAEGVQDNDHHSAGDIDAPSREHLDASPARHHTPERRLRTPGVQGDNDDAAIGDNLDSERIDNVSSGRDNDNRGRADHDAALTVLSRQR
jgi:hypothetical protein